MTTRIITHNNTRYRKTGNDPSGCYYHDDMHDGGPICEHWELLPFIPDWPGHRPEQYLAKAPFTSKKGDLVALRDSNNEWLIYWPIAGSKFRAGKDAYLISRADPEHDAEDTA